MAFVLIGLFYEKRCISLFWGPQLGKRTVGSVDGIGLKDFGLVLLLEFASDRLCFCIENLGIDERWERRVVGKGPAIALEPQGLGLDDWLHERSR